MVLSKSVELSSFFAWCCEQGLRKQCTCHIFMFKIDATLAFWHIDFRHSHADSMVFNKSVQLSVLLKVESRNRSRGVAKVNVKVWVNPWVKAGSRPGQGLGQGRVSDTAPRHAPRRRVPPRTPPKVDGFKLGTPNVEVSSLEPRTRVGRGRGGWWLVVAGG